MKTKGEHFQHAELYICDDGQVLAHNITPELAAILSELAPHDTAMRQRVRSQALQSRETSCHNQEQTTFHQHSS